MLDPGRLDLHGNAVALLNRVYFDRTRDPSALLTGVTAEAVLRADRVAKEMLPTFLHHIDGCMPNSRMDDFQGAPFPEPAFRLFYNVRSQHDRESFEGYLKEHREELGVNSRDVPAGLGCHGAGRKLQDRSPVNLFHYVEQPMPARRDYSDANSWTRKYWEKHLQEICDERFKFLQDFVYLKKVGWSPILEIRIRFLPSDTAAKEPVYMAFLKRHGR